MRSPRSARRALPPGRPAAGRRCAGHGGRVFGRHRGRGIRVGKPHNEIADAQIAQVCAHNRRRPCTPITAQADIARPLIVALSPSVTNCERALLCAGRLPRRAHPGPARVVSGVPAAELAHGLVVPFGEGGAPGLAHPGDHRDGGDTVRATPTAPTAQDGDAPASVAACLPGARAGQPGERFLTCPRHAFRDDAAAGPSGGVVTLRYRQMAGTRRRRVPRLVPRTLIMVERGNEFTFLAVTLEPPIGIEPMTYALRVRRSDRLS